MLDQEEIVETSQAVVGGCWRRWMMMREGNVRPGGGSVGRVEEEG